MLTPCGLQENRARQFRNYNRKKKLNNHFHLHDLRELESDIMHTLKPEVVAETTFEESMGHVKEYLAMHHIGNPINTQPMKA